MDFFSNEQQAGLTAQAKDCPSISLNPRQVCDLELILDGSFAPLAGFMTRAEYDSVIETLALPDGSVWPIPVCLDIAPQKAKGLEPGMRVALNDQEGSLLALMTIEDLWQPDRQHEAEKIYGAGRGQDHFAVQELLDRQGFFCAGGRLQGIKLPIHYDFGELRKRPRQIRAMIQDQGWERVIGFHTDKYLHCLHREMVQSAARKIGGNILLHPTTFYKDRYNCGHFTQIRCYQHISKHFPAGMAMLAIVPLALRKAGPRSALWQAVIRKNYGCDHFMVWPDHADPWGHLASGERFYPLHAAQELVAEYQNRTGVTMVPLEKMVYVADQKRYMLEDEADPGQAVEQISSQELARRLEFGLEIPDWFSYPEIVQELRHAHPPRHKQGFTVFFTGLPGAGKSTLAKMLQARLTARRERPITLLDGDIVRKNLSSELGFSVQDRKTNLTRIGFVASQITKNRGIAICAPIAPFEESRRLNREAIARFGGYIEVYVSTPLKVCESRDHKGNYAKARAGIIKGFTGIDDPYEPPAQADITLDTSGLEPAQAVDMILDHLRAEGYLK